MGRITDWIGERLFGKSKWDGGVTRCLNCKEFTDKKIATCEWCGQGCKSK